MQQKLNQGKIINISQEDAVIVNENIKKFDKNFIPDWLSVDFPRQTWFRLDIERFIAWFLANHYTNQK